MKVALPSMDGLSLSQHFGRSRGFVVLEVVDGQVKDRQFRRNDQAGPAPSAGPGCLGHGRGQDAAGHHDHALGGHHGHDHGRFADLLGDCQAVLVGGIGGGARQALEARGLRVFQVGEDLPLEALAERFAQGALAEGRGPGCRCSH